MPTSIFVVGATGYQGSTLVHELLEQKGDYDITILSRSESSAAPYKEKGCNVLIGDFEATEVLQRGARGADVVFSLASADDLSPVRTLVEALKPKGAVPRGRSAARRRQSRMQWPWSTCAVQDVWRLALRRTLAPEEGPPRYEGPLNGRKFTQWRMVLQTPLSSSKVCVLVQARTPSSFTPLARACSAMTARAGSQVIRCIATRTLPRLPHCRRRRCTKRWTTGSWPTRATFPP